MNIFNKVLACGSAVVATLAISASTTQAQNLAVDPNFGGAFTANPITPTSGGVNNGWALYGGSVTTDMSLSPDNLYPGATSALLTQNTTWGGEGAYQIITPTISLNSTYTFTLQALTDNGFTSYATPLALNLHFVGPWNGTAYPVLSGGGITESANDGAFVNEPGLHTWTSFSVSISTSDATGIYGIVLQPQTINGSGTPAAFTQNIYFDGADLEVSPVPEPTTLALAGLGGAFALSMIRRRK
jgi:hypothetical protein